jgi:hypothetical protein
VSPRNPAYPGCRSASPTTTGLVDRSPRLVCKATHDKLFRSLPKRLAFSRFPRAGHRADQPRPCVPPRSRKAASRPPHDQGWG